MTTLLEASRLALEALEYLDVTAENYVDDRIPYAAITALRQAIKQAQQAEPDYYGLTKDHLWMSITKDHHDRLKPEFRMACYTSPPPRQWVGLTPQERDEINEQVYGAVPHHVAFHAAIEARLKAKNT
jgi:hypothetical protein